MSCLLNDAHKFTSNMLIETMVLVMVMQACKDRFKIISTSRLFNLIILNLRLETESETER